MNSESGACMNLVQVLGIFFHNRLDQIMKSNILILT